MVRLDVWGVGAQTGSRSGDTGIQDYADGPHAHTNTEDFRLGRLTFALDTETGSKDFRVKILGKALMF